MSCTHVHSLLTSILYLDSIYHCEAIASFMWRCGLCRCRRRLKCRTLVTRRAWREERRTATVARRSRTATTAATRLRPRRASAWTSVSTRSSTTRALPALVRKAASPSLTTVTPRCRRRRIERKQSLPTLLQSPLKQVRALGLLRRYFLNLYD